MGYNTIPATILAHNLITISAGTITNYVKIELQSGLIINPFRHDEIGEIS
jgi:hypothetical protein